MKTLCLLTALLMMSSTQVLAKDIMVGNLRMDATIIDVRTIAEYSAGHIDGAINVPVEQLEAGIAQVPGLKKNAQILVYCHSGRRSAIAKGALEKLGFQKIHDGGGMEPLRKNLKSCSVASC